MSSPSNVLLHCYPLFSPKHSAISSTEDDFLEVTEDVFDNIDILKLNLAIHIVFAFQYITYSVVQLPVNFRIYGPHQETFG